MKFIILVSTIIESEEGKILLVVEKKEKILNKLNLPGGHLEFSETLIQGAKREAKEEVSVDVDLKGLVGIYAAIKENQYFHFVFAGKIDKGEAKTNTNEINGITWHSIEELKNMPKKDLVSPNKFEKILSDYQAKQLIPLSYIHNLELEF